MIWNKPKNIWHWLLLLSPGAASLAFTGVGKMLPKEDELAPSMLGLPVTFILCIIVGFLLARGTGTPGKVFGLTMLFIFILMVVNFSIAFGGCAVMQPYFDIK